METVQDTIDPTYKVAGKEQHRHIQISKEVDGKLRLDHDALKQVFRRPELENKPFAIISIAGPTKTGKSFLMNFVLRYMRNKGWKNRNWMGDPNQMMTDEDGFAFSAGYKRCTTGIHVFREVFEVPLEKETVNVVLMDSQGLFDYDSAEHVSKALLTLTTLMSSVQIFNCLKQVDAQRLAYLKACVQFAEMTAEKFNSSVSEEYIKLQNLMFLARDCPNYESTAEESYGEQAREEYLKIILSTYEKSGSMQVQGRLKTAFENVDCFLMPRPGSKAEKITFVGKDYELDSDFLKYVQKFVEEIASPSKLKPKKSTTRNATSREMLNMIAACDVTFCKEVSGATAVQMNEKAYYGSICQEGIAQYDKLMTEELINAKNIEDLTKKHLEMKKKASKQLRKTSACAIYYRNLYEKHFEKKCNENFEDYKKELQLKMRAQQLRRNTATNEALETYKLRFEERSSSVLTEKDINDLHEKCWENFRQKYADVADMDVLKRSADKCLKLFKKQNLKRKKIAEQQRKSEKNVEKVYIKSEKKSREMWREYVTEYRDDESMEKKKKEIQSNLSGKFWGKALTEGERSSIVLELEKKSTDEVVARSVDEIREQIAPQAANVHAELLTTFTSHYEAAQEDNKANLKRFEDSMKNDVDCIVLAVRKCYHEVMRDSHLNQKAIEAHFDGLSKTLEQATSDPRFNQSETARQSYRRYLADMLSEARNKILKQNGENEDSTSVQDSKEVPTWKKISDVLREIAPIISTVATIIIAVAALIAL